MTGPRACGPRNVARELSPARAGGGDSISSFDIAMRWVTPGTGTSCVTPSQPFTGYGSAPARSRWRQSKTAAKAAVEIGQIVEAAIECHVADPALTRMRQ